MAHFYSETVTWWEQTDFDSVGEPQFSSPALLDARWLTDEQVGFTNQTKNEAAERQAQNIIFIKDQDISVGDYVALGDHTGTTDPRTIYQARRVLRFTKRTTPSGLLTSRRLEA